VEKSLWNHPGGSREGSNKKIILYGLFLYFKNILKKN
jgi:hypothetical protein